MEVGPETGSPRHGIYRRESARASSGEPAKLQMRLLRQSRLEIAPIEHLYVDLAEML